MKTIIASLLLVLVATACNKWDGKKDKKNNLTYYCEDFKEKYFDVLGINSSNIDAFWVEFYGEGKEYTNYSLIVKSDGEFTKEHGTCSVDWGNTISFQPEGGTAYDGDWIFEKEKYTISYDLEDRTETLTFIYKETGSCKGGCW